MTHKSIIKNTRPITRQGQICSGAIEAEHKAPSKIASIAIPSFEVASLKRLLPAKYFIKKRTILNNIVRNVSLSLYQNFVV